MIISLNSTPRRRLLNKMILDFVTVEETLTLDEIYDYLMPKVGINKGSELVESLLELSKFGYVVIHHEEEKYTVKKVG